MIRIYPSKLEGEPLESHPIAAETTVNQWLADNVQGYEWRESPPISVHINGGLVDPAGWHEAIIMPSDVVDIYPEPKGVETLVYAVVALVVGVVLAVVLQPSIPKQKGAQGKGDNLNEASLKGNKVKINAPIREIFGRRKVFPDYLVPNHRYFQNRTEQIVETHLSIGMGEFDIPPSSILVGDTPIVSLGDNASFQLYAPGASVAGDSRCEWWHSAPEIGATSTGTAGLELTATTDIPATPDASIFILSGYTITIPSGAGSFPASWTAGLLVRIVAPYSYTVTDGVGVGVRDIIGGNITQLGLVNGDTIEIDGTNAGLYVAHAVDNAAGTLTLNYDNGDPATALVTGTHRMAIGPRGFMYRIVTVTASTLTLERLTSTGATDTAWPGFDDQTLDDAVITLDGSNLEGGWAGPFAACPDGETTSVIEWDVFFPGGLIRFGSKGQRRNWSVTVDIEYRDASTAGAWTRISKTYTERTQDQIGFTEVLSLPSPMRPEVRVRRIGAPQTKITTQEAVQWYGLRSKLAGKTSYAGVTTLAIMAKGGGKLAAQAEQLVSVLATRKLPVRMDGAWSAPVATRDIAPAVAYIGKSLGYSDADLDLDEFDRLAAIWKARGDTFDQSFESTTTAKDSINSALRAGFAEMTIDRGRIRPVRDELRTVFEHLYTPQNCTDTLTRDFQALSPDDFDGVDVEYTDSRTWQVETVECRLPGDLGLRTEKIQVEGVTSRTKAWRIGMRARQAQKYRRYRYSTSTELDALNSRYLSYVALAGDVPGYGKSAILAAVLPTETGFILRSSEPLEWVDGASHIVAIRRPDGTLSGPYAASRFDDFNLFITGLDFTPDTSWNIEPPHLLFGTSDRWTFPALVTEINPRGDNSVSITAINYDARVYQYDDAEPPV